MRLRKKVLSWGRTPYPRTLRSISARIVSNMVTKSLGLLEIPESLKTFLDFGRLLVGVTARTIGTGRSGSRSSPDRVRRKKVGVKNARQDFAVHIFRHRNVE